MKPEQLNWTDKQWAAHLGCAAHDVPKFKKYLAENFWLGLWQEHGTGLKYAEIQMRHDAPSGNIRYIPIITSQAFDMPLNKIVEYTNNQFIPSLELRPLAAKQRGVPVNLLQMLHIENTKQK